MEDNPTVEGEGETESQGTRGGRSYINMDMKLLWFFGFVLDYFIALYSVFCVGYSHLQVITDVKMVL